MAIVRLLDSCGNWIIINTAVGVTADDIGLGNVQNDLTYLTNRKAKLSTDSPDEKGYRIGSVMLSSDFTINANGEISLTGGGGGGGTPAWSDVTNKPFSTIGTGLTVTSDTLNVDIDNALSTTSENPVQNKVIANAGFLTSVPAATVSDFGGFKLVTYTQSFTTNDWTSASSLAVLNVSLATNYSDTNLIYLNSKVSIPGDNLTHYGDDYTLINLNAEYCATYTLNIVEDTSAHTLTAQFTAESGSEFAGTITAQFLSLA